MAFKKIALTTAALVILVLTLKSVWFQQQFFPRDYWSRRIQTIERSVEQNSSTLQNIAIEMKKRQVTARLDVAQQVNNARSIGLDTNEAQKQAVEDIQAEIEDLNNEYRMLSDVLKQEQSQLDQARSQLVASHSPIKERITVMPALMAFTPLLVLCILTWVAAILIRRYARKVDTKLERSNSPVGTGGWLLLLILGLMFLGPILGAGRISFEFISAESQYPNLKTLDAWSTCKSATWWTFLVVSCLSFYAGIGLVRSRDMSVVMRAKVFLWIIGPLATLALGMFIPIVVFGKLEFNPEFFGNLLVSIIGAAIWTAYLSKSKRVRATYGSYPQELGTNSLAARTADRRLGAAELKFSRGGEMRPIVILCDASLRVDLSAAFTACGIPTAACKVRTARKELNALKIMHHPPHDIIACAQKFAEKHGLILQARRDDLNGKAYPVDVTEKNIIEVLAANQGKFHLFMFREEQKGLIF